MNSLLHPKNYTALNQTQKLAHLLKFRAQLYYEQLLGDSRQERIEFLHELCTHYTGTGPFASIGKHQCTADRLSVQCPIVSAAVQAVLLTEDRPMPVSTCSQFKLYEFEFFGDAETGLQDAQTGIVDMCLLFEQQPKTIPYISILLSGTEQCECTIRTSFRL